MYLYRETFGFRVYLHLDSCRSCVYSRHDVEYHVMLTYAVMIICTLLYICNVPRIHGCKKQTSICPARDCLQSTCNPEVDVGVR